MVSFSCEGCGDVLTKKKLDPHRNQCRSASFTCLDCMVHFQGTDYRSHTSCISEAQKYEGALYKDKKKHQKPNSQATSQALVPRSAYVEDAVADDRIAIVDAPPHAPSPPPQVNVFDFLVCAETPNASKLALPAPEESRMIEDEKPPTQPSTELVRTNGSHRIDDYGSQEHFVENGYSYGSGPIKPSFERYQSYSNFADAEGAFYTPAPKYDVREPMDEMSTSKKADKKRKRGTVEELDMALVRAQAERDAVMTDAPPILHSGLTGGLSRMVTRPEFPPSPDYSGGDWVDASPLSPMKRTKHTDRESERDRTRGRDHEPKPRKTSGHTTKSHGRISGAWVRPRRDHEDSGRDSGRDRRRNRSDSRRDRRRRRSSSSASRDAHARIVDPPGFEPRKPLKAIEYHRDRSESLEARDSNALVRQEQALVRRKESHEHGATSSLTNSRAELFMKFVTKGPESERGYSMNKALKRFHRERKDNWDRGATWGGMSKVDEEKELWKCLRLKRNDQDEIVLFFDA